MCSTSPNQNQFEEILENSDLPSCSQSFFIGRDFTSIRSIEIGFSCSESSTTLQKVVLFGIGNIVTLDWNLFEVAPVGNRRHLECSRWRWWTACSGRSHRPSPGRPGRGSWCSRCTRSGAPAVQDQDWCWCAGLVGALGWLVRCSHKGCLGGARWLGGCLLGSAGADTPPPTCLRSTH